MRNETGLTFLLALVLGATTITPALAQTSCEGASFVCGTTIQGVISDGVCPTACQENSQLHSFNVFANTTLSTLTVNTNDFTPAIEIVDAEGAVIERRDGRPGEPARLATVLVPGVYHARVIALPAGSSGTYTIRLTCLLGDPQVFCQPDDHTLCFYSRFSVKAALRVSESSASVAGAAMRGGDNHGYFSAPDLTHDDDNPEVLVKVLDGRAINGRWWIFLGSLTGFDYDVTVRDTFFKHEKTYTKADVAAGEGVDLLTFGDE